MDVPFGTTHCCGGCRGQGIQDSTPCHTRPPHNTPMGHMSITQQHMQHMAITQQHFCNAPCHT
eukprot:1139950-Pelagomonas_calceolata.AAC.3